MNKKCKEIRKIWVAFAINPIVTGLFIMAALGPSAVFADGILLNGIGARAMAMGGADVAYANDPLGAMGANPAGLAFLTSPGVDVGFVGGIAQGEFNKDSVSQGGLRSDPYGMGQGAFAWPFGNNLTLGISCTPSAALDADWHYVDPPGGLGGKTSYGLQTDQSQILLLRSAAGLGYAFSPKFSFGASVGLDYNQNLLETPYVFQSFPTVKGAKTLLSLHTDGLGLDGQAGFMYRPMTNLQFGLTYQSQTQVDSTGSATGNIGTQFGAPNALPFHYDAEVRNTFPESIDAGVSWAFYPQWRLALQIDWVDWGNSFDTLRVHLSNGSNPTINTVAGSTSIQDNVPLDWRDEFVYRAGLEYEVIPNLFLRGGYCFGASPVPNQTLTPLTAAITENTLTAGVGYRWGRYQVDVAYQYDLPAAQSVNSSTLQSGEYSNSSVSVSEQWLSLTFGVKF